MSLLKMSSWIAQLKQFDSANNFGIKTALVTCAVYIIPFTLYIFTAMNLFLFATMALVFIMAVVNMVVTLTVLINLIARMNKLYETFFTLYVMMLNIPFIAGLIYLKTLLSGTIRL